MKPTPFEEATAEFERICMEPSGLEATFWRGVAIGALGAGRLNAGDLAKLANPLRSTGADLESAAAALLEAYKSTGISPEHKQPWADLTAALRSRGFVT